ncbi:4a-hydroxytetrahydrobiopterin dehydratase [Altibacter sp. HG106]|uniref:4a-hydroxytetrahydrobiopterin dehydratase n=1 Tax=Altibacter sp. HG106 TaxID=3023937 RepID=UPI0023509EDD|nr:4a-hydroxytetrahydrobiopterin dehydratase [Altibacter sp. HG106]MDC7996230.1 4a-hydroxytetrahydrobiopterin dehydratase [Altibacter sp. HG106]
MKALSASEIKKHIATLDGWLYEENALHTSIEFRDFKDAFSLMTRIAFEAEKLEHHPDWSNVYNKVNISLSTHDAGGVTEKDFQLAQIIDKLVS